MVLIRALMGMLLLVTTVAWSQAVDPTKQQGQYLGQWLEVAEDSGGSWSASDALAQSRWIRPDSELPNFGFSSSAFWARLAVRSQQQAEQRLLLEIGYPLLDEIDVYRLESEGPVLIWRTGDMLPYDQRPRDHRLFLFPIDLEPGQQVSLLARFRTTSSMQIPIRIWDQAEFQRRDENELLLSGGYFGLMAVMLLYNLVILLVLRDRSYLFYVALVASVGLSVALLEGYAYQFLWPDSPIFNQRVLGVVLMCGAGVWYLFADAFLELKWRRPSWSATFRTLALCSLIASAVGLLLPHQLTMQLTAIWILPACVAMVSAGIGLWREGHAPARYYTLAWGAFILGAGMLAFSKLGILPRTFLTERSVLIGSATEMVILSLALAYRLTLIRDAHERAVREQLHQKAEDRARRMESMTVLATGVAHALNTPLGICISAASYVSDKCRRLLTRSDASELNQTEVREFLIDVRRSSELVLTNLDRSADMIRNFKKLAIDPGAETRQPFDVQRCLQRTVADLQPIIDQSGHRVRIDCTAQQEAVGYPGALGKVVASLVMNSVEHAFREGDPGEVLVGAAIEGSELLVQVCDNGTGISTRHVDRVFDPFFTTQRGQGRKIGLGLHVVYSIVTQQLEGKVNVNSGSTGTLVDIRFPLIMPWND